MLTLLVALDDVLEVIHRHRLEWRQVDLAVDGEERVDLPLVAVLRGERVDVDELRLHREGRLLDQFDPVHKRALLAVLALRGDLERLDQFIDSGDHYYRG